MLDRRAMLTSGRATGFALSAAPGLAAKTRHRASTQTFPKGFVWGAATAPHQIEGNNTTSDLWFIKNQQPTIFAAPSGDAADSFQM